jgi:hypothetical protein
LTGWTTENVDIMVDNPDSPGYYDDMPIVNQINFGLYVAPNKHDI